MSKTTRISLEAARTLLLERTAPAVETEPVPLLDAVGRVSARPVIAQLDQPPFHRSPLDGYALRSADTAGAGPDRPAVLAVTGRTCAGDAPAAPIGPGQAVRIMTGAPIPAGADCVVRQEDTDLGGETVRVFTPLSPHQNFCFRGEDTAKGACLLAPGVRLDWTYLGLLAAQGITELSVFRRPQVGVLTTGDELVPAGSPLAPGQIYDSNAPLLAARLTGLGAQALPAPHVGDGPEALAEALARLAPRRGLILTTGGVSVGDKDYMPPAARLLGAEVLFQGVAVRPGSPAMAFLVGGTPVLALSGNPFAALAVFEVLGRPAVERLSGRTGDFPRRLRAVLRGGYPKASPVRRLLRGRLEGGTVTIAGGGHASGMLAGLAGCNCLVDIPAGTAGIAEGDEVGLFVLD